MNIFVLDKCPNASARVQIDKHVVKMPLECAQMLSTALSRHGLDKQTFTRPGSDEVRSQYKATHKHHPCTVWAGDTRSNFQWLGKHAMALCAEYTERYGRVHKSQGVIEWCIEMSKAIPAGELTPHAQAMPEEYQTKCAVEAYRSYYMAEKRDIASWKKNQPEWWGA